MRIPCLTALLPLVALACGEPSLQAGDGGADADLPVQALLGIPVPPDAEPLGSRGTANSIEVTLGIDLAPDSLANVYRALLLAEGWDIRADTRLPEGGINLHAVSGTQPVWVLIYPRGDGGTRFNVVTGVRDSSTR